MCKDLSELVCPYCGVLSEYKDHAYENSVLHDLYALRVDCKCGKSHIVQRVEMFYLYKEEDYTKGEINGW